MRKYILTFIVVFIASTGLTQTATSPPVYKSMITFSAELKGGFINEFSEDEVLISDDFYACIESWRCHSVLFENSLCCYLTFGQFCLGEPMELPNPQPSSSYAKTMYGIDYRLVKKEESPAKSLMHREVQLFDMATLHTDQAIDEFTKQSRKQRFDFSSFLREIYSPTSLPGIN